MTNSIRASDQDRYTELTQVNATAAALPSESLAGIEASNEPRHSALTDIQLDFRNPRDYSTATLLANLSDDDRDYLSQCLLSIISIKADVCDADGKPINKVKELMQSTGFRCDLRSQGAHTLRLTLSNVPDYAKCLPTNTIDQEPKSGGASQLSLKPLAESRARLMLQSCLDHQAVSQGLMEPNHVPAEQILSDAAVFKKPDHIFHKGVVFMGGGTVTREEYAYSMLIGRSLAELQATKPVVDDVKPRLTGITGGGPGIMQAPFEGIQAAKVPNGQKECLCFGYRDFIHEAPPNNYLDDIAIFSTLDVRLEAFFRAGESMLFFPGGMGTIDEVLYIAALILNNPPEALPTVVFTCLESNRNFFESLAKFLSDTVSDEAASVLQNRLVVHNKNRVVSRLLDDSVKEQKHTLYNDNMMIPDELKSKLELIPEHIAQLEANLSQSYGSSCESGESNESLRVGYLRQLIQLLYQVSFRIRTNKMTDEERNLSITLPNQLQKPLSELLSFLQETNRLKVDPSELHEFLRWQNPETID